MRCACLARLSIRTCAATASFVHAQKLHCRDGILWRGGDLRKVIDTRSAFQCRGAFPERQSGGALSHVTDGLAHLHSLKILHRDLKSSNLFLKQNGGIVLGDLGCVSLAPPLSSPRRPWARHTIYLRSCTNNENYDNKSDVWAVGVVAYELLSCGSYPFTALNAPVSSCEFCEAASIRHREHYSSELRTLIVDACLRQDPKCRPTASQLLELPQIRRWRETDTAGVAAVVDDSCPPPRTPPPPLPDQAPSPSRDTRRRPPLRLPATAEGCGYAAKQRQGPACCFGAHGWCHSFCSCEGYARAPPWWLRRQRQRQGQLWLQPDDDSPLRTRNRQTKPLRQHERSAVDIGVRRHRRHLHR